MALTPKDVANKQFSSSRLGQRGYAEPEVDEFLDQVEAELSRLHRENDELRSRLQSAARAPAAAADPQRVPGPAEPPEAKATGILALAQRTADEHLSEARKEAERLVTAAQARAEELRREAEAKYRETLGVLQAKRTELEQQLQDLRTFEREHRTRVRAYLQNQLHAVDAPLAEGTAGTVDLRAKEPSGNGSAPTAGRAAGGEPPKRGA